MAGIEREDGTPCKTDGPKMLSFPSGGRRRGLANGLHGERYCEPDGNAMLDIGDHAGLEPEQETVCVLLAAVSRRLSAAGPSGRKGLRVVK